MSDIIGGKVDGGYIFKAGDRAIVTGNGGIYDSADAYARELKADFSILHFYNSSTGYNPREFDTGILVGKKVEILNTIRNDMSCVSICLIKCDGRQFMLGMRYLRPIKGGVEMEINVYIQRLFPKTKDAVLISKWFGSDIFSHVTEVLCQGREKELLEKANELEKEAEKE